MTGESENTTDVPLVRKFDSDDYDEMIADLVENFGGVGEGRAEAIQEEFPDGEAYIEACWKAYQHRDTDALEAIEGIGRGYALGKLAHHASNYFGWSGGDAEPKQLNAMSGDEFLERIQAETEAGDE